jgi:hypothetical protein
VRARSAVAAHLDRVVRLAEVGRPGGKGLARRGLQAGERGKGELVIARVVGPRVGLEWLRTWACSAKRTCSSRVCNGKAAAAETRSASSAIRWSLDMVVGRAARYDALGGIGGVSESVVIKAQRSDKRLGLGRGKHSRKHRRLLSPPAREAAADEFGWCRAAFRLLARTPTAAPPAAMEVDAGAPSGAVAPDQRWEFHAPRFYDFGKGTPASSERDGWFETAATQGARRPNRLAFAAPSRAPPAAHAPRPPPPRRPPVA